MKEKLLHSLQKKDTRIPRLLAFFMPFLIVSITYIIAKVFPFGDRQILASDGWHQYYPFLLTLREKLLTGGSLEYIRNVGMGSNYLSLYAYYVASPLNLLSVLVPLEYMREFFTLTTVLKLSFAGYFFCFFLETAYQKRELPMAFFSLMYALCSWAAAYYWNIMWLDAFAVLPLLVAGTVSLLRDGKFRLYVLSLALCLWANYYVAFFCCIFVLLAFIGYCIVCWNGMGNFFRRFLRIGICTLLGAGMAAILLIPTLTAMQYTYSAKGSDVELLAMNLPKRITGNVTANGFWNVMKEDVLPNILPAFQQVASRFLPGYEPASMEGLPNIFCGFSAVILSVFYFCNGKIKLREKLVSLFILLFLMLSFIFRILDYIWHGFHFPNMLPYRFSFLVPFVVVCTAYRAFSRMDNFRLWKLAIILPISAGFVVSAYFMEEAMTNQVLICSAVVLACTIGFFIFYGQSPVEDKRQTNYAKAFLCFIILCEMCISYGLGMDKVGTSSHNNYPKDNRFVQALLDYAEDIDNDVYYRMESTNTQTLNDGALNNYYGLSVFNSSANVNFNRFSRALGFASWPESNRYAYYEGSPFGNTFAGLKYLIDREGNHLSSANSYVAVSGTVKLLENKHYLGLGFMTDMNLSTFQARSAQKNALLDQEEMFSLATGIDEKLYSHLSADEMEADEECTLEQGTNRTFFRFEKPKSKSTANFKIRYTMEKDGLLMAFLHMPGSDNVTVYRNDLQLFSRTSKVRTIVNVGDVEAGDEIEFVFKGKSTHSGTITLDVAYHKVGLYELGMNALSDETWNLTAMEDTYICGDIVVQKDGFFYSSIPYEPGWTAYVDGEEVAICEGYDPTLNDVMLKDAVISFPLDAGYHIIEMKYDAPGLRTGALISLSCTVIFVALCILLRKKPVLFPHRGVVSEASVEATEETFEFSTEGMEEDYPEPGDWEETKITLQKDNPSATQEDV
ncbi:MAG: YfhO family protein [Oscillospiraceae bacterium]|nr:YfhO family protein [Oscillospiraceae bacterium]